MTPEERDKKIVEEYAHTSASKLAVKYGLSLPQINRIVKDVEKGPATLSSIDDKIIDEEHRKLGLELYFFRMNKKSQSTTQASVELNWSVKKIRNIEQGFTPLTMMDLTTMAKYMGITRIELLGKI